MPDEVIAFDTGVVLGKHGCDRKSEKGENQPDDISLKQYGTSAAYPVARLKRDHPEIAEALARGEFPSARAAAIAAGFRRKPSALEQIRKLLPKLTYEERIVLAGEINKRLRGPACVSPDPTR